MYTSWNIYIIIVNHTVLRLKILHIFFSRQPQKPRNLERSKFSCTTCVIFKPFSFRCKFTADRHTPSMMNRTKTRVWLLAISITIHRYIYRLTIDRRLQIGVSFKYSNLWMKLKSAYYCCCLNNIYLVIEFARTYGLYIKRIPRGWGCELL